MEELDIPDLPVAYGGRGGIPGPAAGGWEFLATLMRKDSGGRMAGL
jgi:hypothetical protein